MLVGASCFGKCCRQFLEKKHCSLIIVLEWMWIKIHTNGLVIYESLKPFLCDCNNFTNWESRQAVWNVRHVKKTLRGYFDSYNNDRNHLGIKKELRGVVSKPSRLQYLILKLPRVGGFTIGRSSKKPYNFLRVNIREGQVFINTTPCPCRLRCFVSIASGSLIRVSYRTACKMKVICLLYFLVF